MAERGTEDLALSKELKSPLKEESARLSWASDTARSRMIARAVILIKYIYNVKKLAVNKYRRLPLGHPSRGRAVGDGREWREAS